MLTWDQTTPHLVAALVMLSCEISPPHSVLMSSTPSRYHIILVESTWSATKFSILHRHATGLLRRWIMKSHVVSTWPKRNYATPVKYCSPSHCTENTIGLKPFSDSSYTPHIHMMYPHTMQTPTFKSHTSFNYICFRNLWIDLGVHTIQYNTIVYKIYIWYNSLIKQICVCL